MPQEQRRRPSRWRDSPTKLPAKAASPDRRAGRAGRGRARLLAPGTGRSLGPPERRRSNSGDARQGGHPRGRRARAHGHPDRDRLVSPDVGGDSVRHAEPPRVDVPPGAARPTARGSDRAARARNLQPAKSAGGPVPADETQAGGPKAAAARASPEHPAAGAPPPRPRASARAGHRHRASAPVATPMPQPPGTIQIAPSPATPPEPSPLPAPTGSPGPGLSGESGGFDRAAQGAGAGARSRAAPAGHGLRPAAPALEQRGAAHAAVRRRRRDGRPPRCL